MVEIPMERIASELLRLDAAVDVPPKRRLKTYRGEANDEICERLLDRNAGV